MQQKLNPRKSSVQLLTAVKKMLKKVQVKLF